MIGDVKIGNVNIEKIKLILPGLFVIAVVLVSGCVQTGVVTDQTRLKKFSSQQELEDFLKANTEAGAFYGSMLGGELAAAPTMAREQADVGKAGAEEYSTTNIQVEGVDEADIVKNDGKYIYTISRGKVVIVDAYPAEYAEILSEIEFNGTPSQLFINGDRLVVMGQGYYSETDEDGEGDGGEKGYMPEIYREYGTFIHVYDLTDRSEPLLEREVFMKGYYLNSRMIGDYVYIIINQHVYYSEPGPVPLPVMIDAGSAVTIPASRIYYFDVPDYSYVYTNILALNTQEADEEVSTKTFLMGYSHNMCASIDNIYLVYTKRLSMNRFYDRIVEKAVLPSVPSHIKSQINAIRNSDDDEYEKMEKIGDVIQDYIETLNPEQAADFMKTMEEKMEDVYEEIAKEMEKTVVHRIHVSGSTIEYKTSGEVPGYVLNQFSMDEFNGYFRIATTTGSWRAQSANHLYVLDSSLNTVGKVEDLAKGERIYSTRFIGNKGYMVTFRQVDPLFVIDLSNPYNPQVLGYLKTPGVSDYLHPYDETHLIGLGRDATEEGRMLGLKLSLFDITDFANPKEISKYTIGDSWSTTSEALYDHKAFLFDKKKRLLVIPVSESSYEVIRDGQAGRERWKWEYWQGAYVFDIDLSGFTLKGKISHLNETDETQDEDYWPRYDYSAQVRRSLYMDDVLYTISSRMIKMNDLADLIEINKIDLPYEEEYYPYPMGVGISNFQMLVEQLPIE